MDFDQRNFVGVEQVAQLQIPQLLFCCAMMPLNGPSLSRNVYTIYCRDLIFAFVLNVFTAFARVSIFFYFL